MVSQPIQHVLVIEDDQGKRIITLKAATCSIGRDSRNTVVLDSDLVSRQHAILLRITIPETTSYLFRIIDGNLQGKRSKNGLSVNGKSCLSHDLKHGDEVVFGGQAKATYYTTSNPSELQFLTSCKADEISTFASTLHHPFETLILSDSELRNSNESALERLASFPELFSHPIAEINLTGAITYLNPAAATEFPDIRKTKLKHPILAGIVEAVQIGQEKFWVREVAVGDKVFEQSVNYIAESDLIRSYVINITARKQAQAALQSAHNELEIRVGERTAELKQANQQLQAEIAERRRAEDALRASVSTNRALLNAIPDWMFRISAEGDFVNFKAPKNSPLPLATENFFGQNLSEILPPEVAGPLMECVRQTLSTGDVQIVEYQLQLNGSLFDYEARVVLSAKDEVMAIIRDITERKQAETEIRNALEKEKQLTELKSRFVSMVSHEFRTPLATILSSSELLEHYSYKWSDQKKNKHLQRIQLSVKHMTELLNDALLIGQAEVGKLECNPQNLDLVEFCKEVIEEIEITTNNHAIVLQIQGDCKSVEIDPKLLRHILINLLSNAVKYSFQGDSVYLDLICKKEQVNFRIKDTGIGIPVVDQSQIFHSFNRASNVGSISGTGLGLAIVKKAVDMHHGDITFESEVGVGTTFIVVLPLNNRANNGG